MTRYTTIFWKELRQAWPLFAVYGGWQLFVALDTVLDAIGLLPPASEELAATPEIERPAWFPHGSLLLSVLFVWGGIRLFQGEIRDRTFVWMRTFAISDAVVALLKIAVGALAVFGTHLVAGLIGDLVEPSYSVLSESLVAALSAWCWLLVGGLIGVTLLREREATPFVFLWLALSVTVFFVLIYWQSARGVLDGAAIAVALRPSILGHLLIAAPLAWGLTRLYSRGEIA